MKIPKILFKNKKPQSGIYCIENTINGKLYIGSSLNMYQRLHAHRIYLNNNVHQNKKLQNSWNKHTESNFICYSIENCNKELLTEKEQYYIDTLKPWYNITILVIRNIPSFESRIKISDTLKDGYKTGRIKITKSRNVDSYDLEGNFIKSYKTIRECSKDLNINHTSIQRVLKGLYKQCKGYQFKYHEDIKEMNKIKIDIAGRSVRKPVPIKSDKLLENPEEDNQQPIINLKD